MVFLVYGDKRKEVDLSQFKTMDELEKFVHNEFDLNFASIRYNGMSLTKKYKKNRYFQTKTNR